MTSSQRNKQGHLSVGVTDRGSGRKIDTWTFRGGDVAGARTPKDDITFEVSLLKTMEFTIDTKGIPKERWSTLRGPVLTELHAQALEIARAEFDLRNELTWSDWLEIRVEEPSSYDRRQNSTIGQAMVSYHQIPRAEKPDGTAFTVNGNGLLSRFPEPVGICRDADGLTGSRRPKPEVSEKILATTRENSADRLCAHRDAYDDRPPNVQFAYLPDTSENRAGLNAIINAIQGINQRLQQFLHPEEIDLTLQRALVGSSRLLAGPSPADDPAPPARRAKP